MQLKRWVSYSAMLVVVASVTYGVAHGTHKTAAAPGANWVATVTQRALDTGIKLVPNTTAANRAVTPYRAPQTTVAANRATTSQSPTSGLPTRVVPVQQKPSASNEPAVRKSTANATANSANATTALLANEVANTATTAANGDFTIIVSENKGATLMATKQVAVVPGENLMQYMHQNFTIETAFGDDFMLAINGIKSQWNNVPLTKRQPVDWFFYINGHEAPVGAASIQPRQGDVDTWDYHRWNPSTGKG